MRWTQIAERRVEDVVILDLLGRTGDFDFERRFITKINELLRSGQSRILLNLRHVMRVDAVGLGEIVRGCAAAREANAVMKLCVSPSLMKTMRTTQFDKALEIFELEGEALESFRN
jgi:anti-anti-sigma regulatory factor